MSDDEDEPYSGMSRDSRHHAYNFNSRFSTTSLACAVTFLISCSGGFSTIPLTYLVEEAVCHDYFQSDGSGDCKSNAVQSRVANILAVEASIEAFVGMLVAVPWSSAVKRLRRSRVLLLAFSGVIVNELWWIAVLALHPLVPIQIGWLSSLGLLCGGGAPVIMAQIFTVVTEAETEEHRSIAFTRIHVASMLGNMLAPGLASVLVRVTGHAESGLWIGVLCVVGGACLLPYVPNTPPVPPRNDVMVSTDDNDAATRPLLDSTGPIAKITPIPFHPIPLVALLLASLLLHPIGPSTTQFLVQYAAKRFDVDIADMGYVLAFYGALQLFQALVLLPLISRRCIAAKDRNKDKSHSKQVEQRRDVLITRTLVFALVPGLLILAMAPALAVFLVGLIVMALGSAHGSYVKSLMVNYVEREYHSSLFGLTAMMDVAGSIYSAFLLAKLFKTGLNLGGIWTGMPYLVLTAFVVVAEVALFVVRPLRIVDEEET